MKDLNWGEIRHILVDFSLFSHIVDDGEDEV